MANPRAGWSIDQERRLLDKVIELRNVAQYQAPKGLKSKGWNKLATDLQQELNVTWDKGKGMHAISPLSNSVVRIPAQFKSKLGRIMNDYDLYRFIMNSRGMGICPVTGNPQQSDEVWEGIIKARPSDAANITAIRTKNFEHRLECSLICGDTRATGTEAATLEKHLEEEVADVVEIQAPQARSKSSAAPVVIPPSQDQRKAKIKRIRDGASAANREKKKTKNDDRTEMFKVVTQYFKFKMKQAKQSSAQDSESEDDSSEDEMDASSLKPRDGPQSTSTTRAAQSGHLEAPNEANLDTYTDTAYDHNDSSH